MLLIAAERCAEILAEFDFPKTKPNERARAAILVAYLEGFADGSPFWATLAAGPPPGTMWRLDLRGRRSAAVCAGTGQPGVHCPPYNVDYEGYTEEKLKIKSDSLPAEEFNAFLLAVFASCRTETGSGRLEIQGW